MVITGNTMYILTEGASPLQRMQDLEAQVETPQVTNVVNKRDMAGTSIQHEKEDNELEQFDEFKQYKETKKRSKEKENHKKEMRVKEWDRVSIHTYQLSDSSDKHSKRRNE